LICRSHECCSEGTAEETHTADAGVTGVTGYDHSVVQDSLKYFNNSSLGWM